MTAASDHTSHTRNGNVIMYRASGKDCSGIARVSSKPPHNHVNVCGRSFAWRLPIMYLPHCKGNMSGELCKS